MYSQSIWVVTGEQKWREGTSMLCVTINSQLVMYKFIAAHKQTIDIQVFHQLLDFIVWMISILPNI